MDELVWKKSSLSGQGDNCVEVAQLADNGRVVRNSNDPLGPQVRYTEAEWIAFLGGVRNGEFD